MEIAQDILNLHNEVTPENQFALSLTLFNSIVNDRTEFVELLLNCGGDMIQVQNNIKGFISELAAFICIDCLIEKYINYNFSFHHVKWYHSKPGFSQYCMKITKKKVLNTN